MYTAGTGDINSLAIKRLTISGLISLESIKIFA